MSLPIVEGAFTKGEIAPAMYGRIDQANYHTAASTMRNMIVNFRGGAYSRAGTAFCGFSKQQGGQPRLIPFQFSTSQGYALEFGNQYMRVWANGGAVLESSFNITDITQAQPMVITASGNNFVPGDWVYVNNVYGMPEVNGQTYVVTGTGAGGAMTLNAMNGYPVDSTGYTPYISGGTIARIYTISTPYAVDDLPLLKFAQSADVMSIAHPNYAPYELERLGNTNWVLTAYSVTPAISAPTGAAATVNTTSSQTTTGYSYVVTAVDANGNESQASTSADVTSPIDIAVTAGSITVAWNSVVGAISYNIYKAPPAYGVSSVPSGQLYGYAGSATDTSWVDSNVTADFAQTPPLHQDPLTGNNPGNVGYFQERRVYANSNNDPDTMWFTKPGNFYNFDTRIPTIDTDAITSAPWAQQVNGVQWMIQMPAGLVVLTGLDAWQVTGAGGSGLSPEPITPSSVQAQSQAFTGAASTIPPIKINYDILYVQSVGSRVRDLSYQYFLNIYTGTDLTVWNSHLFTGYNISEWAWCLEPDKLVWSVMEGGNLLSMAYLKEQDVYGWSRHDTAGTFLSCCAVTEPPVNALYLAVKRQTPNGTFNFIERMDNHIWTSVENTWCVDAGVGSTPWETGVGLGISGNAVPGNTTEISTIQTFGGAAVGWIGYFAGGMFEVTQVLDSQHLNVKWLRATLWNTGAWELYPGVTTVGGLYHLAGSQVYGIADGAVVGPLTVNSVGQVTLPGNAGLVCLGIPFTAQLQTPYLAVDQPTEQGRRKNITAVTVRFDGTGACTVGSNQIDSSAQYPPYQSANWTMTALPSPAPTYTTAAGITGQTLYVGDARAPIAGAWLKPGQVAVQQTQPLPLNVTAIVPEYLPGDIPEAAVQLPPPGGGQKRQQQAPARNDGQLRPPVGVPINWRV